MTEALKCGVGAREFWELTPRETFAEIEAAVWQQDLVHRRNVWLAWHVAAFVRSKRMPSLRSLFSGKTKRLTGEELQKRRQEHKDLSERIDLDRINELMATRSK